MKATKVNAGLAESNGSLLPGLWRDSLHVTCGLTACTPGSAPGPTLGNEYGKTLPLLSKRIIFRRVPSVLLHCWLGVRKSIRPIKNKVMRCWRGYLSGASCRLFACSPAGATAIPKVYHLLPHLNPDWFYISGTGIPRLSWKRGR